MDDAKEKPGQGDLIPSDLLPENVVPFTKYTRARAKRYSKKPLPGQTGIESAPESESSPKVEAPKIEPSDLPERPSVPPDAVDVLENKDIFFNAFQHYYELLSRGEKNRRDPQVVDREIKDHAIRNLRPLWEGLNAIHFQQISPDSIGERNVVINNPTSSPTPLQKSKDFNLTNGVVAYNGEFEFSKNAIVRSTLMISNNGFHGIFPGGNPDLECKNPTLVNFSGFGKDILKHADGGLIAYSVIGGEGALSNSHGMRLVDTYLAMPDGIYYYEDETFDRFRLDPKNKVK